MPRGTENKVVSALTLLSYMQCLHVYLTLLRQGKRRKRNGDGNWRQECKTQALPIEGEVGKWGY